MPRHLTKYSGRAEGDKIKYAGICACRMRERTADGALAEALERLQIRVAYLPSLGLLFILRPSAKVISVASTKFSPSFAG